jgi:polyhydroxyalkanoate synthesis repressor PhaR
MSEVNGPRRLDIRKYPNRRYYDTTHSRHLTLEQIYSLIRDGYEIQVTDSRSGEDITAKVLAQILLELDSPKLGVFPSPLLHRLIRANEQLVIDFTQKYFNQALTSFLDSQRQFETYLREAMNLRSTAPSPPDWMRMMLGPFVPPLWPRPVDGHTAESAANADPPGSEELHRLIGELREEIKDLRGQLARNRKRGGKKSKPAD